MNVAVRGIACSARQLSASMLIGTLTADRTRLTAQ